MQNVILLHGALGFSADLELLGTALQKYGIKGLFFSFSGHGKKPFQKEFNIPQFTTELEDFIMKNELGPVHVFGYSMGGYVTLNLALKQSPVIGRIITLGTKFNWAPESIEKEVKLLNPDVIAQKSPELAKRLEEKHGQSWKELLAKTAELMRQIGTDNLLNNQSLRSVLNPVLIGLADRDKMVSLEETRAVFEMLPNASMYMLPSAKHPIESVDVELLAKIISDFIKN